jgi:DNA repair exonuclease SbcCD nuclease subunit
MRILHVQDIHLKGINPIHRIGDYCNDILTKVDEVGLIAKHCNVDIITDGGDVFNSPVVAYRLIDDFVDIIEQYNIPYYILEGNHTEEGNHPDNGYSVTKHIFKRSKLIRPLNILKRGDTLIQGFHYYHGIEKDLLEKGLKAPKTAAKVKIAIIHAFITLKPFLSHVLHAVAKDINTDFDYILVGHNHIPWRIKEINGIKWINIGCLGRRTITETEIKPSVLFIDTNTEEMEIIPLESAKASSEVFNLQEVAKLKQFNSNLADFINSLKDTQFQALDLKGIIGEIAKKNNVDRKIVENVITRIGRFENE